MYFPQAFWQPNYICFFRNSTRILIVIFLISPPSVAAENSSTFYQNGIIFRLFADLYAYAPEDMLSIHYVIENKENPGVLLPFPDSRRSAITVNTPMGVTGSILSGYFPVVTQEYISKGESLSSYVGVNLGSFRVVRNDTLLSPSFSVNEGDTLTIVGRTTSRVYGIEEPGLQESTLLKWEQAKDSQKGDARYDPQLDQNQDGVINFPDYISIVGNRYILNWNVIPEAETLSLQVVIRRRSADVNRDQKIDFSDFLRFAETFGRKVTDNNYDTLTDLNGDGQIDFNDFIAFAVLFQKQE